ARLSNRVCRFSRTRLTDGLLGAACVGYRTAQRETVLAIRRSATASAAVARARSRPIGGIHATLIAAALLDVSRRDGPLVFHIDLCRRAAANTPERSITRSRASAMSVAFAVARPARPSRTPFG